MRWGTLWFAVSVAMAQTPSGATAILTHARDRLLDRTERVPNYICSQTVDRNYFRLAAATALPSSCDQVAGARKKGAYKLELEATDRLHLDVKVSEGREIGSWAGANKFDSRDILDFIGGGPYGTGPLGTLIGDIFGNRGVTFVFDGEEDLEGKRVYKYEYRVPLASSHYNVKAGAGWVVSAFSGAFWIDPSKFELKRLTANTPELSAETQACAADMSMDYETMRIGTGDFLIPKRSELHFFLRDGTENNSITAYSGCHQYHGEATLRFDDSPAASGAAQNPAKAAPPIVTAGLPLTLAFADPIDTATAAAGDAVKATVRKPVRMDKSTQVLIPAGSVVRGRLVRMQHLLGANPNFVISILLESIDIGGVRMPFYAMPDDSPAAALRGSSRPRRRGAPITRSLTRAAAHDRDIYLSNREQPLHRAARLRIEMAHAASPTGRSGDGSGAALGIGDRLLLAFQIAAISGRLEQRLLGTKWRVDLAFGRA